MQKLRNKVIEFIFKTYASYDVNGELKFFENNEFNSNIDLCFNKLIKCKHKSNNPYAIKFGGQCGSGKTTQLLPSIANALTKYDNDNYIHLAVRLFAKYHPNYEQLLKTYGQGLIREKTNAIALSYMFVIMERLIKNGYNVLCEVSLLDPVFEEYFIKLAKLYKYNIIYNIISVPFEISNMLANNRTKHNGYENGRIMPKDTLDYFNNILPFGVKQIIENKIEFNKNDYFILWNIFNDKPLIVSNAFEKNILNVFEKNRIFNSNMLTLLLDEKKALDHKCKFYDDFFRKYFNYFE